MNSHLQGQTNALKQNDTFRQLRFLSGIFLGQSGRLDTECGLPGCAFTARSGDPPGKFAPDGAP
jgi:hypothetical protein